MTRTRPIRLTLRRLQRGISIVMAIFLLLLFGVVAALIASLISTANITQAQDIEGARAYQAARAGVEWGMFQLDPNAATAALPACFSPNPTTLNQMPGFTVTVGCTPYPGAATSYQEGSRTVRLFLLTARAVSTASTSPGIERLVEVTVEKCRDTAVAAAPFDC